MGGLGELVLRGIRNSAIVMTILTAGCGTFHSDYAPLRSSSSISDSKTTIHYVFSPANEIGKLYLEVISMWKDVFGNDIKIRPYCTALPDNGVADEMYCQIDPERATKRIEALSGEEVTAPSVFVEDKDDHSFKKATSDAELCTLLGHPSDCLDAQRSRLYMETDIDLHRITRNRRPDSQPLRY